MSDTDPKDGQSLIPAPTDVQPPAEAKSAPFKIVPDGKGGVSISPNDDRSKKADDGKKKFPRGSSVFRHA
jgi:hypothetical protein